MNEWKAMFYTFSDEDNTTRKLIEISRINRGVEGCLLLSLRK